jgi:hypothetical protein
LPDGRSVSFLNEIPEERKEFLRVDGFCGGEQAEKRFLAALGMMAQQLRAKVSRKRRLEKRLYRLHVPAIENRRRRL